MEEDILARLEVTQQVRLREAYPSRDVAERDLADGTLAREVAGGGEDRFASLLLVFGAAGSLEPGDGGHGRSVSQLRERR